APDIKSPPLMHLAMNALIAARAGDERFLEIDGGGFIYAGHVAPLDRHCRDLLAIAEGFVGVPYLWGGRTRIGLDCSGLVQSSLQAAGFSPPPDTTLRPAGR